MAIFLKIAGGKPDSIEIKIKPVLMGRAQGCDVVLTSEFASGQHCIFFLNQGQVTVKDLKSTNGTMLNGELVANTKVFLGDIISIGRIEIALDVQQMSVDEIKMHTKQIGAGPTAIIEIADTTKVPLIKAKSQIVCSETVTNYENLEEEANDQGKGNRIKKSSIVVNNVDFLKENNEVYGRIHKSGKSSGLELTKGLDAKKRELRKNRLKKIQETISVAGVKKLFSFINEKIKK